MPARRPSKKAALVIRGEDRDDRRRGQVRAAQGRFRIRQERETNELRARSTLQASIIVALRMEIDCLRNRLSHHEADSVVPRTDLPDPALLAPPPPPKPKRRGRAAAANKDSDPAQDSPGDNAGAVAAAPDRRSSQETSSSDSWDPYAQGSQQDQWADINRWRESILNQPSAPSFGVFGPPPAPQPQYRRETWQPVPGIYDAHPSRPGFERIGTSVPNLRLGPSLFQTPEMVQPAQFSAATTPTWTSSGSGRRDEQNVSNTDTTALELPPRVTPVQGGEQMIAQPTRPSQEAVACSNRRDRAATTASAPAPTAPIAGMPMLGNDRFALRHASAGNSCMMTNNASGQGINEANGAGPSRQPYINEASGAGPFYQVGHRSINEANGAGPSSHPLPSFPFFHWNYQPVPSSVMPAQEESIPPHSQPAHNGPYGLVGAAEGLNSTLISPHDQNGAFTGGQFAYTSEQEQERQTDAALAEALSYDAAAFASNSFLGPDSF